MLHTARALSQGVLPLIPDEVAGIKLKDPITTWWTELHAKQGACEQCSLTVLYTLIEFMCLMTVPTVVGALLVLFAAFAPAAANMAIGVMEEKVRARAASAQPSPPRRPARPRAGRERAFLAVRKLANAQRCAHPGAGRSRGEDDPAGDPCPGRRARDLRPLLLCSADGARDRWLLPADPDHPHDRIRRQEHHECHPQQRV